MTHKGFMAGLVGIAIVTTAGAGFARPHGGIGFEMLDLDGNGEVTLEEMRGARQARFQAADSNGDGVLSRDEMINAARAEIEPRVDRMIERFDTDGDGAVSLGEMPGPRDRGDRAARMFDRADSDDSGGLSRDEFDAARAHMSERRHGRKKADD